MLQKQLYLEIVPLISWRAEGAKQTHTHMYARKNGGGCEQTKKRKGRINSTNSDVKVLLQRSVVNSLQVVTERTLP